MDEIDGYTIKYHANGKSMWFKDKIVDGNTDGYWEWYRPDGTLMQIDLILAVFFFAKLGMAYFDYRKHAQFEWAAPAILLAWCSLTQTAPLYIWGILGM